MNQYRLPDWFPKDAKIEMAVVGYRTRVAVQRLHQELTFNSISTARDKFGEAQKTLKSKMDQFSEFSEFLRRVPEDDSIRMAIWESGAAQSLYTDLGAVVLLVAASSVEELHQATGLSIFDRGAASYIGDIPFARAVTALANQYKHRAEWIEQGKGRGSDFEIVAKLVDDPLRPDAAAEFLLRSAFASYEAFEAALLSCADGIVDRERLPDGKAGIPTFTISAGASKEGRIGQVVRADVRASQERVYSRPRS
jgi:hypothetical protein